MIGEPTPFECVSTSHIPLPMRSMVTQINHPIGNVEVVKKNMDKFPRILQHITRIRRSRSDTHYGDGIHVD